MLVPYEIETLLDERPYANWALIGITSAVSLLALTVVSDDEAPAWVEALVLDGSISLTEWDNRSLLEIFEGDSGEQRKEAAKFARLLAEQEEEG